MMEGTQNMFSIIWLEILDIDASYHKALSASICTHYRFRQWRDFHIQQILQENIRIFKHLIFGFPTATAPNSHLKLNTASGYKTSGTKHC